jgi:hypothetical protein
MTEEEARYAAAWKVINLRGWIAFLFAIEGISYAFLYTIGVITFDRHKFLQPYILPMLIPILAANWYLFSRCPHCGKWYFSTWLGCNFFAQKCLHCGLPRGALNGSEGEK